MADTIVSWLLVGELVGSLVGCLLPIFLDVVETVGLEERPSRGRIVFVVCHMYCGQNTHTHIHVHTHKLH